MWWVVKAWSLATSDAYEWQVQDTGASLSVNTLWCHLEPAYLISICLFSTNVTLSLLLIDRLITFRVSEATFSQSLWVFLGDVYWCGTWSECKRQKRQRQQHERQGFKSSTAIRTRWNSFNISANLSLVNFLLAHIWSAVQWKWLNVLLLWNPAKQGQFCFYILLSCTHKLVRSLINLMKLSRICFNACFCYWSIFWLLPDCMYSQVLTFSP